MFRRILTLILIVLLSLTNAPEPGGLQPIDEPLQESSHNEKIHDDSTNDAAAESNKDEDTTNDSETESNKDDISAIPANTDNNEDDNNKVEQPVMEKPVRITISFAGDCTIGTDESFSYVNSFPYRFEKVGRDYSYFFKGVKPIFADDNLTLVNLETTLTNAKKKAQKKFRFKGPPSYVNILTEGSIEMVNISNNHIYDYLEKGFEETLDTLDKAGIAYSGEGKTAFHETEGITIAVIGYNGWSTGIRKSVKDSIKKAKSKADIVIVSFHWGIEREYYPNSTQTVLGRYAIDQGADVVVGHHPHVIQGIEKYKDKYIVYSLGNFCFGGNRNPADKDTFIFRNTFTFEGKVMTRNEGVVIPCSISSVNHVNDFQPVVLKGKDRERVINRILKYSSKLEYGIKEDDVIFENFNPVVNLNSEKDDILAVSCYNS